LFDDLATPEESVRQMEESISQVLEEIPEGPLIVGGFSQGGAMASALLETEVNESIIGLVLIATKTVRGEKLRESLSFLKPRPVIWMHGERDHLVPIELAREHAEIFDDADWPIIRLEHEKGHMVNRNQFEEMRHKISLMAEDSHK
jgi:predicted esterase